MSRCLHGLLLLLLSFVPFAASAADGVLIPAPNAVDMVHDAKRGLVYISTSDGKILRYKISTASFLTPFVPSPTADLSGIDLMPDYSRIAVADRDSSSTELWAFEVNPNTGTITKVKAKKYAGEAGMFAVAYSYNGDLYAASMYIPSAKAPIRRFYGKGRQRLSKVVTTVMMYTMLAPSADRKTIAFAESGISNGPWGIIDVPTGQVVRHDLYEEGLSGFNYEISTDTFGATFILPDYAGAYVFNDAYQHIATIGVPAEGQPVGAAFHPTQFRVYFPWATTSEIRVYDTTSWQQVGTFDAGYTFDHPGNISFQPGRARLSANGQYLMVKVDNGVRLIDLSVGMAAPKSAAVAPGR
ncbi:MAG: WD40 repeat domain-containing protein [Thermomonas sp.]